MTKLTTSEAREGLAEAVNKVAFAGERIVINRHGKDVAALVSMDDLAFLQEIEDHLDVEAMRRSLAEKGSIPWAKFKTARGL